MKRMAKSGVLLVGALAVFLGCSCNNGNKYQSPPPPEIDVAQPRQRTVVHYFEYPAVTQSVLTADLVARVSGFLDEVNYMPGGKVNQGDLLMVIEPQPYKAKVSEAEANLATAQAKYRLAKESLERIRQAAKSNAVSEMDVIKAETDVDQSKAAVISAQDQLSTSKITLDYCYIRAPFPGRVSKNNVDRGNYVSGAQVLATVFKDDKMYVNFNVEDSKYISLVESLDIKKEDLQTVVKKGQMKIQVVVGEADDMVFEGKIDYVAPNIDVKTGTFGMRAVLDNPNGLIRSGLFVKVRIPFQTVKDAILIPEYSIGSDQSGRYIYVLGDSNKVVYRNVEVGVLEKDNMREIVSGLKSENYFVTKAILKVRDGQKISPQKISLPKE